MAKQQPYSTKMESEPVSSELVTQQVGGEVVVADFSEFAQDGEFAKESFKKANLALPFISIAQSNSPELKKQQEEKFIAGLKIGMLFNTVSRKFWHGFEDREAGVAKEQAGITALVVKFSESYTQWWPRSSKGGKGFVKDFGADATILDSTHEVEQENGGKLKMLDDGTYIQDADLYYLIISDRNGDNIQWALLSMKGTQRKKSRKWNTIRQNLTFTPPGGRPFKPAPFFFAYQITTAFEKNDKGDWYGYVPELIMDAGGKAIPVISLPNGRQMYDAAKSFFKVINSGGAKVDHSQTADPDSAPPSDAF